MEVFVSATDADWNGRRQFACFSVHQVLDAGVGSLQLVLSGWIIIHLVSVEALASADQRSAHVCNNCKKWERVQKTKLSLSLWLTHSLTHSLTPRTINSYDVRSPFRGCTRGGSYIIMARA